MPGTIIVLVLVFHSKNYLHGSHSGGEPAGRRLVVPMAAGTLALSPQLHDPLSTMSCSCMGLQEP